MEKKKLEKTVLDKEVSMKVIKRPVVVLGGAMSNQETRKSLLIKTS